MIYYLKLRHNIALESDIQLAKREVCHLFGKVEEILKEDIEKIPNYVPNAQKVSYTKESGVIGYVAECPKTSLKRMAILLSFIQEIWSEDESVLSDSYSLKVNNAICTVPLMAMSEMLSYSGQSEIFTAKAIVEILSGKTLISKTAIKGITRTNTSSPHVHSYHKYKAKFFPRFVRSLIVSNLDLSKESITVCDPYVGSGTTLVESSMLGFDSFGYDIDPLSCFISEIKSNALNTSINDLCTSLGTFQKTKQVFEYTFPDEIQKKFVRWDTLNDMYDFESEISKELSLINNEIGFYKQLNQIALSDALTRKFNIRMMGTGSGRFALEIAKTSIQSLIKGNMKSSIEALKTVENLKELYKLTMPTPSVYLGDATNRNCIDGSCDIIVTSPPYLPASSGREDYLVGKMISLKALGLLDNKEQILQNSVGSMKCQNNTDLAGLPDSVIELYKWLANDELRSIKAVPIVAYYHSLKKSLSEDKRSIKDDGKIIYIIGKESIFYSNKTKEILYKVECDNIFVEIAESVGLSVDEVINIELDKKNAVARPRSSDKYYETAIIMSKKNIIQM